MKVAFVLTLLFMAFQSFGESIIPYEIKDLGLSKKVANGKVEITFKFTDDFEKICNNGVQSQMDAENLVLDCDKYCWVTVDSGEHSFYFEKEGTYSVTFTSDFESGHAYEIWVYFQGVEIMVEKPVIYIHSSISKEMAISIDTKTNISFSYPPLDSITWNFWIDSTGKIQINDEEYTYLFWDGEIKLAQLDFSSKNEVYVEQKNLLSFLEKSADDFGFTSSEKADFITYWYPQMKDCPSVKIQFLFNSEAQQISSLSHSENFPVYQFYMFWTAYEKPFHPQKEIVFPEIKNETNYILEWGGGEIPSAYPKEF